MWCLTFAVPNVVELIGGRAPGEPFSGYAEGIAVMSAVVLVLKLIGAGVALAAVRPRTRSRRWWWLATALWGATALLGLYSAGNIAIVLGVVSGVIEPSAAWQAAGGVTLRSIVYLVFFLVPAPMFGALAVSYQRVHRFGPGPLVVGAVGAPVVLAGVLVVAPAILAGLGLLPA